MVLLHREQHRRAGAHVTRHRGQRSTDPGARGVSRRSRLLAAQRIAVGPGDEVGPVADVVHEYQVGPAHQVPRVPREPGSRGRRPQVVQVSLDDRTRRTTREARCALIGPLVLVATPVVDVRQSAGRREQKHLTTGGQHRRRAERVGGVWGLEDFDGDAILQRRVTDVEGNGFDVTPTRQYGGFYGGL